MITYSTSLQNRLAAELRRAVGSEAVIAFYTGPMPLSTDEAATGEKVGRAQLATSELEHLCLGEEPHMPAAAGYWRILDNGGLCVLQGDGNE